ASLVSCLRVKFNIYSGNKQQLLFLIIFEQMRSFLYALCLFCNDIKSTLLTCLVRFMRFDFCMVCDHDSKISSLQFIIKKSFKGILF
ncbi:MAG: hypothetical protein DWQ10_15105, partial [Calditrichaeota bacterium]